MTHITDNHDALLDYLYEEGDPAERLMMAKHLQECAACSVAVLEFQNVRGMLRDWTPPASASLSAPANYRARPGARALLQVAAGVLLFAAGVAASSQLHVEYADGTVAVGVRRAAPAVNVRHASITLPAQPAAQNVSPVDTEALLQRVRAMIDQSETRQQRELALRLSQVAGEVDTQHQADLLRIQQNFGQQQEMMDYIVRTSGGQK